MSLIVFLFVVLSCIDAKIAIIVPIHPPKYEYARQLQQSHSTFASKTFDLYFVFSSKKDQTHYETNETCSYCIVVPRENGEDVGNIVTYKKFYGLYSIMHKYKYAVAMDAEAEFIKTTPSYERLHRVLDEKQGQKRVWGTRTHIHDYLDIQDDSMRMLFPYVERQRFYTWWNELPVYACATLPSFFELMHFPKNFIHVKYSAFDHIVYQSYQVMKLNYSIVSIPFDFPCNFNEQISKCSSKSVQNYISMVNPLWITKTTYQMYPEAAATNEFVFLIFHKDRTL